MPSPLAGEGAAKPDQRVGRGEGFCKATPHPTLCAERPSCHSPQGESDCLVCQAVCHGRLSLRMALRMVRSFRATAMRATIFGLPAATRRSKKAFKMGLCRLATIAPMNSAVRTASRPPPMKLLPRHCPDWRVNGARPARAAICLRPQLPELGQFGQQRAGDDFSDARYRHEKLLLLAPDRRATHRIVDIGVDAGQLLLQRLQQTRDALAQMRELSGASRAGVRRRSSRRSAAGGRPDRPTAASLRRAAAAPAAWSPRRSGR